MRKIFNRFFLIAIVIVTVLGCKTDIEKKAIHFEVIRDSLFTGENSYKEKFEAWKKIYESCVQTSLFSNAIYTGLQDNVHIGSIDNKSATNINKQFNIFDTSNQKYLWNLLVPLNQANCYSIIGKEVQGDFYTELIKILKGSEYNYLTEFIDTNKITFKITTINENTLRPDSLSNLLERTKDPSLFEFKKQLLTPGNILLLRTVMITGFLCEFPLLKKLSIRDEARFSKEIFFDLGPSKNSGSIKLLPNQNIQILLNKYYTVLGQIYISKETK